MIWLEVIFFNKSRVNDILPALDNDENTKDNIKYVIFCNLLVQLVVVLAIAIHLKLALAITYSGFWQSIKSCVVTTLS